MPSGSKKRKAAKKKMEKQSNNNPVGSSDVEGGRSNAITEANTVSEEVNIVRVEREFKIEDKHNEKGGRRVNDKKKSSKSYDGGSSRSSSSSSSTSSNSDDESHRVKTADSLSSGKAEATNGSNSNRVGDSVSDNVSNVVISEKIETPSIVDSVSEEVKEPIVSSSANIFETSVMDSASGQKETSVLVEKIATISDPKQTALHTTNDQLNLSYNVPTTDKNSADREEDSGVAEPLLVPSPRPVHTSWKSCCGLFELFTGSST